MAGPSSKPDARFQRLAALPPYVLATVDELKSRLRAAGHDVYDFGLGNPDGASPRAAVERLIEEAQTPGNQRYMPSRGRARGPPGDLRLVRAQVRTDLRPRR